MNPRKRSLIVKFGQIGDVIMAIPAVHALHQQNFEIHWLCGKTVQPLLECYSWIHVLPADDKAILHGNFMTRAKGVAALWSSLALSGYELSAVLYYDWRYKFLTLPVRATKKTFLSHKSRHLSFVPGRHHTDEYRRILLGEDDDLREHSTPPVRPDRLPVSPIPLANASPRIAIVPGGAGHLVRQKTQSSLEPAAVRRWPIGNYVEMTRQLLDRGWEVILLGGPEDAWAKSHFSHLPVTDCIGTLSIPQVISVMDTCNAVVSHDTGPLHLAGLTNACLIGIFGPTNPSTFLPRRPFVTGIWGGKGFACRPCYDGRTFAPCHSNGCIQQISPTIVLHELDDLLEARGRGTSMGWKIINT